MSDKKTAIITGAARGIGRAIAAELAAAGYYVVMNYRSNDEAAAAALGAIKSAGGEGELAKFDVADSRAAEEFYTGLLEKRKTIDVLVNNAGVTADGLFLMMPESDWDLVINTTLKGFYNMTKPALKKMMRAKSGSVVSIASVSALIGNRGQGNYSAAKAGLVGANRSIASEVARLGIRMNVVAPGIIETDMIQGMPLDQLKNIIPMGRIGRPAEIARVVRFLCSDDASYITGQVISVNGGMV